MGNGAILSTGANQKGVIQAGVLIAVVGAGIIYVLPRAIEYVRDQWLVQPWQEFRDMTEDMYLETEEKLGALEDKAVHVAEWPERQVTKGVSATGDWVNRRWNWVEGKADSAYDGLTNTMWRIW